MAESRFDARSLPTSCDEDVKNAEDTQQPPSGGAPSSKDSSAEKVEPEGGFNQNVPSGANDPRFVQEVKPQAGNAAVSAYMGTTPAADATKGGAAPYDLGGEAAPNMSGSKAPASLATPTKGTKTAPVFTEGLITARLTPLKDTTTARNPTSNSSTPSNFGTNTKFALNTPSKAKPAFTEGLVSARLTPTDAGAQDGGSSGPSSGASNDGTSGGNDSAPSTGTAKPSDDAPSSMLQVSMAGNAPSARTALSSDAPATGGSGGSAPGPGSKRGALSTYVKDEKPQNETLSAYAAIPNPTGAQGSTGSKASDESASTRTARSLGQFGSNETIADNTRDGDETSGEAASRQRDIAAPFPLSAPDDAAFGAPAASAASAAKKPAADDGEEPAKKTAGCSSDSFKLQSGQWPTDTSKSEKFTPAKLSSARSNISRKRKTVQSQSGGGGGQGEEGMTFGTFLSQLIKTVADYIYALVNFVKRPAHPKQLTDGGTPNTESTRQQKAKEGDEQSSTTTAKSEKFPNEANDSDAGTGSSGGSAEKASDSAGNPKMAGPSGAEGPGAALSAYVQDVKPLNDTTSGYANIPEPTGPAKTASSSQ